MIWFTSDTHFGHTNASKFRGFDSVAEMDEALIERWNARVAPDDDVYHLGDFSFVGAARTLATLARLHGRIRLVPGNHDGKLSARSQLAFYEVLKQIYTLKVPDGNGGVHRFVLCHFPLLVWDRAHYGAMHLHGHSHGHLRFPNPSARIMDVGVDACEFLSPVSLDEVLVHMLGSDYKPFDHHEEPSCK